MSLFHFFDKKNKNERDDLKSVLTSLEKNEIVMEVCDQNENLPENASKIGGKPYLPSDFVWPVYQNPNDGETRPLSFLCQINLSDVRPYDIEHMLPETGMLSFFYECEAFCWGFDPKDHGCARVFYFENTENFVPFSIPDSLAEEYTVPEMAVCFKNRQSYPDFEELDMHSGIDCDYDDYEAALEERGFALGEENHKLLGYANLIQGEILSECERIRRGIYCGDAESYRKLSEEEKANINEKATAWTLLLQLSTLTKDDFELMWGDCGMLYFYIRKEDLAEKRFENAWFSLQCG
jgi:uncharacterized protein YwqG